MRTFMWMSGVLAIAVSVLASCEVGRGGAADDAPQPVQVAEAGAEDASACFSPDSADGNEAVSPPAVSETSAEPMATAPPGFEPAAGGGAEGTSQELADGNGACPDGMVLVEGSYCPEPEQKCIDWMEDPAKFPYARCRAYEQPSTCKVARVPMRFCIDRYEAGDESGLPVGDVSWTQAKAACEAEGKRLCQEQEWVFACEGEEMRPYPYGFVRNPAVCNFEKTEGLVTQQGELADHRQPVTSNPQCLSPFGVQNMVGNIDEWVVLDKPHFSQKNGGRKMMSGLKGGWWGPLRNRCRPTTVDHDELFHELQTGYRCCADAR
jgi:sulfatase modifying factor 1